MIFSTGQYCVIHCRMLDKDPANRPSASEVLRNEYIAQNLAVSHYLYSVINILHYIYNHHHRHHHPQGHLMAVTDWRAGL